MLKDWLRRLPTALGAALYWYAAAWLCFSATGGDPIDAVAGTGTAAGRVTALVIVAAAVIGFALADRAWSTRR